MTKGSLSKVNWARAAAILCIVAGLTYWCSGIADYWERIFHSHQHVRDPFDYDNDTLSVTKVEPEAARAGLRVGDKIIAIDGVPYHGQLQWADVINVTRPGDVVTIGYMEPSGRTGAAPVRAASPVDTNPGRSDASIFWQLIGTFFVLPGVCLVVGAWVLVARPSDWNAWLLYLLLAFPSVMYYSPKIFTGTSLVLQVIWFSLLQFFGPMFLLLFGVYFPERSRVDVRLPWLKYLIIGPTLAALVIITAAEIREYSGAGNPPFLIVVNNDAGKAVNFLNLMCVLACLGLIADKLRSASTADARRRMRVLSAGMGVGMTALLVAYVLLPDLGYKVQDHHWIAYVGGVLFMFAPFSMAYVVFVERAMDVRVLVRSGTRYLLARTGIWVVQILLLSLAGVTLLRHGVNGHPSWVAAGVFLGLVLLTRFVARKRVQTWLDRKFFREAYDAEQVLNDLSMEVRRFTETEPLLQTVARRIADTLHIDNVALLLRAGETFKLQQALGLPMDGTLYLPPQASSVRHLAQTHEPVRLYRNDPDAWYMMAERSERETLDSLNAEVLLAVPGRNRLMGVMALGPKRSEAAYSRSDLRMLQNVASQTGLALEVSELAHSLAAEAAQRERVNREMEIAREVQERLFPQQMPQLANASLAGMCRPALGVGGDYYDVIPLSDGRIGLAIGDVSGKGISAALLMASLRASLRGLTLEVRGEFGRLMEQVNRLVYESSASNRYATFFFGAFNPETCELECVNAGHNPPIIVRGDEVISIPAGGPVIGLLPFATYEEQTVQLQPGDVLLLYTDGISEAMTHQEEEWGEERMIAAARGAAAHPAAAILKAIFDAADRFTAGASQHDDMTTLVLRVGSAG